MMTSGTSGKVEDNLDGARFHYAGFPVFVIA